MRAMGREPYDDWDAYYEAIERAYEMRIEGRTCMDCANCEQPDEPFKGQLGWCLMNDGFVYPHDTPRTAECGAYE